MNSVTSIIIPCKNEGENVRMTIDSLFSNLREEQKVEIIVVDDASEDGCCDFLINEEYKGVKLYTTKGLGAAQARNYGAKFSEGDILVFCDAHIKFEPEWLEGLTNEIRSGFADAISPAIAVMGNREQVGYGQTWDGELKLDWLVDKPTKTTHVPLLPGGCIAVSREAFDHIGGFDEGFKVWGHEDEELSLKLWLFGHPCAVNPNVIIEHLFRTSHPYSVLMYHVHYNLLRMVYSHFKEERIEKIKENVEDISYYERIMKKIAQSDVMEQREHYLSKRSHNDDWFMSKFGINF